MRTGEVVLAVRELELVAIRINKDGPVSTGVARVRGTVAKAAGLVCLRAHASDLVAAVELDPEVPEAIERMSCAAGPFDKNQNERAAAIAETNCFGTRFLDALEYL